MKKKFEIVIQIIKIYRQDIEIEFWIENVLCLLWKTLKEKE